MESLDMDEAIRITENQPHKKMLRDFKNRFEEKASFTVTSRPDHFEIIVSHPSEGEFTGGAEQYLLDKKTGTCQMGWHEHPMRLPGSGQADKKAP